MVSAAIRPAVPSWATRGSVRLVVVGVMAVVAVLSGCGSGGGKVDTSASASAPADTASPTVSPTAAPTAAGTTPSATSADLPSGGKVAVIPKLSKYDQSPQVLALRAWLDKQQIAFRRMDPLYGPMAQAGSGALLAQTRQVITDYRARSIKLHGAVVVKVVAVNPLSPTRVQINACEKDDASWLVYPNGKPVQAVVTKNWLPHQFLIEFVGGRWVATDSASQKLSCAAAD